MNVNEKGVLSAPSDARIKRFEEYNEIVLPFDYIKFLKEKNGAVPTENIFFQNGRDRVIERFLPLMDDPKSESILGWYDIAVVSTQLDSRIVSDDDATGSDIIPIAALFAGDFVCLDYRNNPKEPAISVWDHEESDDLSPVLVKVASSFTEFLGMLRLNP